MNEKSEIASLNILLNRSKNKERLLSFFPPKKRELLRSCAKPLSSDFHAILSSKTWSRPIHYSWFYEELKEYPKALQTAFLSLFSVEQRKGLSEMLQLAPASKKLSSFASNFLMQFLRKEVEKEEISILESLPESEMSFLLKIGKNDLLHLVDLLGIYDLATDLRQIVDKELLGKIYGALSREKLQFLHYASRQPMKWVSPKLNLERWNGSKKILEQHLHQRGLIRLARAISDESADFKWHFLHHLDTGRAKYIQKVWTQISGEGLISYFKGQVLHILERYRSS